jgi:para-nitrobenzyl esterase
VSDTAGQDPPASLAADMHGAWVRFVTDGDPGRARYETNRRPVMVFDEPSAVHEDLSSAYRW